MLRAHNDNSPRFDLGEFLSGVGDYLDGLRRDLAWSPSRQLGWCVEFYNWNYRGFGEPLAVQI